MGNRSVIINKKDMRADGRINPNQVGVYLHWNGGRDSVEAFLKYCELQGYRSPSGDHYGWACLCKVIGNYFGDGLSLGIDIAKHLDCDNYDNGVYIIDGWKIVGRLYQRHGEQDVHKLKDMLLDIDKSMPEKNQLGEDFLNAEEVPVEEIKIGDKVYLPYYSPQEGAYEVIGYGQGVVNGSTVTGIPYVGKYSPDNPSTNPNNYLAQENYFTGAFTPETVRRVRSKQA